jgi:hypothetical protein
MTSRVVALVSILSACCLASADVPATERPAAINGNSYAIVAPTFNSSTGSQSYVRLFNGGIGSATFNLTVVGSTTGNTYGTAAIAIPQFASPQFNITTLLNLAHAGSAASPDTGFTLYFQSAEPWAGYQHVAYNSPTQLFGNNSACKSTINEVASAHKIAVLNNVHTTLLSDYPSTVYIHNPNNASVNYHIELIDAGYADPTTGAVSATSGGDMGGFEVTIGANSTYSQTVNSLLSQAGWQPSGNQYHANLLVFDRTGTYGAPVVSQAIVNQHLNGQIDMSEGCSITLASQVQSVLTSASLTRYCAYSQLPGHGGDPLVIQVTAAGAMTITSLKPGSGTDYVVGTGQATGTTFTGTVTGGGTASGTIGSGTISGSFTSGDGSGTFSGATCN